MQTSGLHLLLQGDIKGRSIRNTGRKSEDEEPAGINLYFQFSFHTCSWFERFFYNYCKKFTLFTGILCPNSSRGMFKLLKQLNSNNTMQAIG